MSSREVRVVILYEDKAHRSLLIRLVKRLNLRPVRYEPCTDCTGVLRRVPTEVEALRARNFQKNLGLIVMIDADKQGLAGRQQELHLLVKASGGDRQPDEKIVFLVPALAIETWYVHLCHPTARPLDEQRPYKQSSEWRELEADLGAAAQRAIADWPTSAGAVELPSLRSAVAELERFR